MNNGIARKFSENKQKIGIYNLIPKILLKVHNLFKSHKLL